MPVPQWQPGTTYAPGALVVPRSSAPPTFVDLTNPSLTDTTGWDLGAPMAILADGQGYAGKGRIYLPSTTSGAVALNQSHIPVNAGQVITTSAMMKHATAADSHSSDGSMQIHWYKADNTEILPATAGNGMPSLSSSDWQKVEASGPAPAGVAYCRIGVGMYRNSTDTIQASSFGVFYTPQTAARATMYKATQPKPGKSANTEPTWPPLGQSVTDNQVIWEGVNIDRLVWQASPLLTSGATEPTWPNAPGTVVHDGTIDWVGTVPYITDPNCPNTPVVAIMASKVFAADKDIVRFCATANALDWSSPQDAGYLPTGLQQSNSNDMAVLAPYRSNLTAFNASCFQNWQVDPDPAAMALLDQMEGIGSIWPLAAHPVGNELFYLSQLGVRSVSIAAGADNLKAGDVGMPVDSLVQDAIRVALANNTGLRATYYPGAGQYWLAVSSYPPDAPAIAGSLPTGVTNATADFAYTVSGGVKPYGALSITSGALPPGLSMDATGHVTGQYTTAGTYSWVVGGTDAEGTPMTHPDSVLVKQSVLVGVDGATLGYSQTGKSGWTYNTAIDAQFIAYGNDTFVGISQGTSYTSPDLVTWTTHTAPASTTPKGGLAFGVGVFVTGTLPGGTAAGQLYSSPDGVTWTALSHPAIQSVEAIRFINNLFVAVDAFGKALASPDGATWTLHTLGANWALDATFGGTAYMAAGNQGATYTSPDAATWTLQSTQFNGSASITRLGYFASKYIAIVNASNGLYSSPDGKVWTKITTPSPAMTGLIDYNGDLFTVGSSLMYTADLVTFSTLALSLSGSSTYFCAGAI